GIGLTEADEIVGVDILVVDTDVDVVGRHHGAVAAGVVKAAVYYHVTVAQDGIRSARGRCHTGIRCAAMASALERRSMLSEVDADDRAGPDRPARFCL